MLAAGATFAARVAGRDPGTNIAILRLEAARSRHGPMRRACSRGRWRWRSPPTAWAVLRCGSARSIRLAPPGTAAPAAASTAASCSTSGSAGARRAGRSSMRRAVARHLDPGAAPPGAGNPDGDGRARARTIAGSRPGRARLARCCGAAGAGAGGAAERSRPSPKDLMVLGVTRDGPAAQAGVLMGDILVAIDGARSAAHRDSRSFSVRRRSASRSNCA